MKIEIHLSHETSFGNPKIRCTIDENAPFYNGDSIEYIHADIQTAPGFHELVITHYNKQVGDQLLDETGKIIKDKHVEIQKIVFDDIPFLVSELREAHFYPVYNPDYYFDCKKQGIDLPYYISPNLYLGHNGTWKLNFHTPFIEYIIKKRKDLALNLDNSIYQSDVQLLKNAREWFNSVPDIVWKP